MATYKTSQFFKIKSSTDLRVPVPSLSELTLYGEFHGKKLSVVGDYPRRLNIGDVVFQDNSIKVLSPVNGIANYFPSTSSVKFSIDGELNFRPTESNGKYTLQTIQEKIINSGLVSLDFPGQSLASLFASLISDRDSFIIFSPFTKEI